MTALPEIARPSLATSPAYPVDPFSQGLPRPVVLRLLSGPGRFTKADYALYCRTTHWEIVRGEAQIAEVTNLHIQGKPNRELVLELGISLSTVKRILQIVYQRWRDRIDNAKYRLLEEVNEVRQEAWEAWEKSKDDTQIRTRRIRKAGGTGNPIEISIRTEGQHGDTRYLRDVEWANEREGKIRGIDAPKRHILDLGNLTNDELRAEIERRREELKVLKGRGGP